MVKTTRIIFGPKDLSAVRAQCRTCQGEVVVELNDPIRLLPQACPWCHANWVHGRPETDTTREFFETLRVILGQRCGLESPWDHPLHLRFELEAGSSGK